MNDGPPMGGARRITLTATVVTVAALAFLLAAAPGLAGKRKNKTRIVSPSVVQVDRATGFGPDAFIVWGDLDAGHRRCISNRKVVVRVKYEEAGMAPGLVDVARTGRTGAWAAIGDIDLVDGMMVDSIVAKAKKRKIKISKRKTLVCKGDTGAFSPIA
jgi:hypothetical protein